MSISVNQQAKVFHLQTAHSSYIFHVMANGDLGQLYFGRKIHVKDHYDNLAKRERREAMVAWGNDVDDFQPDNLKTEYAAFGRGDFRDPAYQIAAENGSRISELAYAGYHIDEGKARLSELPSAFGQPSEGVQTLTIDLADPLTGLQASLHYSVFEQEDVIVRSTTFSNLSDNKIILRRAMSAQLDLPDSRFQMISFAGSWARERQEVKNALNPGIQSVGSLRTASSHQENPFIMLARPETTEDTGDVFAFNLIYSGNFLDQVEVNHYDLTRVLIGIHPEEFAWTLDPNESFQTPEAVLSFSKQGFNQLSQQLTNFYANHLVNPRFAKQSRPILVNNWEATYFDFNEDKLLAIAKKAAELGIELFVLDDGWFGHRDDDHTSLGDWFVDKKKLPQGLPHLADAVHGLGLKFGLWFEPEMISMASELYKKHPDWLIASPKRQPIAGRNQYVLDFTRNEIVDAVFQMMAQRIEESHLDYVKWDMNRYITDMFGSQLPADRQLEMAHRYILGVYHLYQRLIDRFPDVLFESCASGGGRFDLGMMYYAPQAWTSDNTDALSRIQIQYGTSYGYAPSMMGAHVSDVPNYQTGRITPLSTRGRVAYFGDLGYELDITKLSEKEQQEIKKQVAFYKRHRQLFQFGTFYRLQSPFAGDKNVASWEVVNADRTLAIAARYQFLNRPNPAYLRLYFKGLSPDRLYRINGSEETFFGDELEDAGYAVDQILDINQPMTASADFSAHLFIAQAVE
ncbi:MAG: alpha-galactosidase [Oenococcus sp.]|uniref:alpha-galactosidase n=1 Tax=Oenococcus sp. TaxID=1979414 RepID=UPI0039EB07CD